MTSAVAWALLCELSLLGWIALFIIFLWKTFPPATGFSAKALPWGASAAVSFTLWVVSMLQV